MASSDKGSLRVEFSKNPLGKKRDRNGNLVDHSKSFPRYQPMDISGILPEQLATVPSTLDTTVTGTHGKSTGMSTIQVLDCCRKYSSSLLLLESPDTELGGVVAVTPLEPLYKK